jgi:hypothetical protein
MNRKIVLILVALVATSVYGLATSWNINQRPTADWWSGSSRDIAWSWMKAIDDLVAGGGKNPGTGSIFYVDSGVTNEGDGSNWANAKDTLDEALNLCTDSRGDIIYVAQGHAETYTAADGFDADVIGVTIIGLGSGSLAPTFTFNHANAEVAVGADNVTIQNLRFLCSVTGVLVGVDIEAGADYCTIQGCTFWEVGDASGTDEFVDALYIGNACIGTTIQGCTFRAEAAGAVSAITSDNDTSFTTIRGNTIVGDYSTACIEFATVASTDLHILDNLLVNGDLVADNGLNSVAAISIVDASGGLCAGNRIAADTATNHLAMTVFDDGVFIQNFTTDDDGDDFEGTVRSGTAAVTASADG